MPHTSRTKLITETPEVSDIRVLTREDLQHLTVKRPTAAIQSLRDSHHRIARAVASGLNNIDTAAVCGISVARVGQLKADPAFQELVAHYRAMITDEWRATADPVNEFLGSIRTKSLAMIEDKLDEAAANNEFLPSRDLAVFAELGLDRTGYGKVNKNVNINLDFAAKLEDARRRSATARVINPSPPIAVVHPHPQSAVGHSPEPAKAPRSSTLRRI